ncbi:MAG: MgtC/SapB family protein [Kiritimatiellae bacterium]|nr:MgtC/SapB family protein [Kiritimatiellia bacterium]
MFLDLTWHEVIAITVALLAGALIGIERQFRDKAAGLRTMIFICMGATLFTLVSMRLAPHDPVRVAANIVTGVGFLGAGVILRTGERIVGVTTASVIWMTAALGMAIAGGYYLLAALTTFLSVMVLWFFRRLTLALDKVHEERSYSVTFDDYAMLQAFESFFGTVRVVCDHREVVKSDGKMVCVWHLAGPLAAHQKVIAHLLANPHVRELRY